MRYGLQLLAALALVGCIDSVSSTPTDGVGPTELTPFNPMPPIAGQIPSAQIDASAKATGWLWVTVLDGGGPCIDGAVIEIVSGQGKGLKGTPLASCDAWNMVGGYFIYGLIPGVSLTIRASATGYQDGEKTFLPSSAEYPQASIIELSELYGQPSIPLGDPMLAR